MGLISDSLIKFVNLDHRTDRLALMEKQLNKVGLNAIRKRGVLPNERLEEKSRMTAMLKRKQVGALGCYLSQVDIMKEALAQDKHAFIMEDDLLFCSDFRKRIEYIDNWQSVKNEDGKKSCIDWSILWLGGTFHVGGKGPYWHTHTLGMDAELTSDPRMIRTYGSFCTYAYIINVDWIERVLKLLDEFLPESIGIDHSMINISSKLFTYAFVPGMVKQIDNASDQYEGAYTTFSGFEKLNGTIENSRYWFQDKMEDFDPTTFDWCEAKTKDWNWLKAKTE